MLTTLKEHDNSITMAQVEDRLSALPDALLVEILSRMPIVSAAATSVLTPRWRLLWTQLTHLSFDSDMIPVRRTSDHVQNCHGFIAAVDDILRQLTSPKIHSFRLSVYEHSNPSESSECETCSSSLASWIRLIYARDVEVIKVRSVWNLPSFIRMPPCLLQTQSLVELDLLVECVQIEFPGHGIIALPKLKKLTLDCIDSRDSLLFKSCPLLEHLKLSFSFGGNGIVVDIYAPNLKYLNLTIVNGAQDTKFVIDAPKLENFYASGVLAFFYDFVTVPTRLHCAHLDFFNFESGTDHVSYILGLVQGISSVRSLVLSSDTLILFRSLARLDDSALPIFRNLTHLDILYCLSKEMNWSAPLPACLLANLKIIHVSTFSPFTDEMMLLRYILRTAKNLEELVVFAL